MEKQDANQHANLTVIVNNRVLIATQIQEFVNAQDSVQRCMIQYMALTGNNIAISVNWIEQLVCRKRLYNRCSDKAVIIMVCFQNNLLYCSCFAFQAFLEYVRYTHVHL